MFKRLLVISFIVVHAGLLAACGGQTSPTATTAASPTPAPSGATSEPTLAVAAATPTLPPLAPHIVAVNPPRGEELGPSQPIEITFNQPLDARQIELSFEPAWPGKLEVQGNVVRYVPASYERGKRYVMQLKARANGQQTGPLRFPIQTQGYVEVTSTTPYDLAENVDVDDPITIAFNRPIVPLGSDPEDPTLPQPLRLQPVVSGKGRWLSTSIYVFQPDEPLLGGMLYTATVSDLTDMGGSILQAPYVFHFSTALPKVLSVRPRGNMAPPTTAITITFTQPMNPLRTDTAVLITTGKGAKVAGEISWSEDKKQMVFQPQAPLPMGAQVNVNVTLAARNQNGAGLASAYSQAFSVAPMPAVLATRPQNGASNVDIGQPVVFRFAAPVLKEDLRFDISPPISDTAVYTWYSTYENTFSINFPQEPRSTYTVTLAGGIHDPYGNIIDHPTTVSFTTGDYQPYLYLLRPGNVGIFDAYREPAIRLNYRNIRDIDFSLYRLDAEQFVRRRPDTDYSQWQSFRPPENQLIRRWTRRQEPIPNQVMQTRQRLVDAAGDPLPPGIYYLIVSSPQIRYPTYEQPPRVVLVISRYNVVIKKGQSNVLVWVTDLQSGQPVPNLPVRVFRRSEEIAHGVTNAEGVYQGSISQGKNPWDEVSALVGSDGDIGWTSTDFDRGISVWNFDLPGEFYSQPYRVHLYTDRPLYRAGDTIHARAIIRRDDPAGYALPPVGRATFTLRNPRGEIVIRRSAVIDSYGAITADFVLGKETTLGSYSLSVDIGGITVAYSEVVVAAFRKPEYELSASAEPEEVLAGQAARATVQASYFSGGPVKNAATRWTIYGGTYRFPYDDGHYWSFTDYYPDAFYRSFYEPYRQEIANGEGLTDGEGRYSVDIPTELQAETRPTHESELRTIEFTVTDVNDQEISGSTSLVIHAAGVYPGVRPDRYVGEANKTQLAHFIAVDALSKQPLAGRSLEVGISLLDWHVVRQRGDDGRIHYTSTLEETPVVTTTVQSGADGTATLDWTPEQPGEYLIRATAVDDLGNRKRSAAFMWITGRRYAPWRVENNDRIELVPDKDAYQPGETAHILVPSPFQGPTTALVTIEQRNVISHRLLILQSNSEVLDVPILPTYAPDVFVSVLLVQPPTADESPAFKLGLAQLNVDISQRLLQISLSAEPDPAQPGDTITYHVHTSDYQGRPVAAQLSLALVDKALLSLRPDAFPSIRQTFWAQRGLGVRTGVSLIASFNRIDEALSKGAKGGGGGGAFALADISVRADFRDLAYWNAAIETNGQGDATVQVKLPDNLTTWQMIAVGATRNTLVGQSTHDLLATKPLLIRPVLPRFVVHGDLVQIGAIVQNNSGQSQQVSVDFELDGLSPQGPVHVETEIADGDLSRIDLPVAVVDIDPTSRLVRDSVSLRIMARGQGVDDAVMLSLPVRRYSSPETTATSGMVAGEPVYEGILLPERYDPTQGELTLRLDPSLAAGMTEGLRYLKHYEYECTEQTVSRFLPNILTMRALRRLDLARPELEQALDEQVNIGLQRLVARQNTDGGWGWFAADESHPYTSAYVLFALTTAAENGYTVDKDVMQRGAQFLSRQLGDPAKLEGYELNRQAFFVWVLDAYARTFNDVRPLADTQLLWQAQARLSRYAQAYLAMTLQAQSDVADTSGQARSVLGNLLGKVIASATGAHWEEDYIDWWSMNTDHRTTAMVLDALVQIDPDNPLGPDIVRWLMNTRHEGHWASTHETAWILIALSDWMAATGELHPDYDWRVSLNGASLGAGHIGPAAVQDEETLHVAIADLLADQINVLELDRGDGPGRLYYTAYLRVYLPVPDLKPLSRGITVSRRYTLAGDESDTAITSAHIGDVINVELTLVLPSQMHYLLVEDPIPAGTEPIDTSLATTSKSYQGPRFGEEGIGDMPWWWRWWWNPTSFELKDDKVAMFATSLRPGTYTFRYQLRASIAGEFMVLPPRAEMMYYPEVFGRGAGSTFTITR